MRNIFTDYEIFDIDPKKLRSKNFYEEFVIKERQSFWSERAVLNKTNQEACCLLCGNMKDNMVFLEYDGYRLSECGNCGLVFANIFIDERFEKIVYDNCAYEESTKKEIIDLYEYRKNTFAKERLKYIQGKCRFDHKPKILDVGCGPGYFLDYVTEQGFVAKGLELTDFLVDFCVEKGLNVKKGHLEDESGNDYDIVTMFDVLEHLSDPVNYFNMLSTKVKNRGVAVMYTPNIHSFSFYFQKYKQNLLLPYEHICFYNEKSLSWLAEKCGFKVCSIEYYGLDMIDYLSMKGYEDGVDYNDNLREIIPYVQALIDDSNISNHMRVIFEKN